MATDTDLNQYLSVKKYAPYRKETRWDATRNDRLKDLKQKITEHERETGVGNTTAEARPTKKRMGRKERLKLKALAQSDGGESPVGGGSANGDTTDGQKHSKVTGKGVDTRTHATEEEEAKRKRKRRKRSAQE